MIRGLENTVANAAAKAMWISMEKYYWERRGHKWEIVNALPNEWTFFEDKPDLRGVKCRLIRSGSDQAENITRVNIHLRDYSESWHLEAVYRRECFDDGPFMFWQDEFFRHAIVLEMSSGSVGYAAALGDTAAAVRWLTYWKMLQPSDDSEE